MAVPPRPTTPPTIGAPARGTKNINKTRNGGGFNPSVNPSLTLNVKAPADNAQAHADAARAWAGHRSGAPGAGFMSNEDIRQFCEYLRKDARNRATERSMDADHLEAVLSTIPDVGGSMSGARARSRRVSRHLKRVAAAEKNIQKYIAALYGTFEREYESELRKVGKGRIQSPKRSPFGWR